MANQTLLAIVSIAVTIPLLTVGVLSSAHSLDFKKNESEKIFTVTSFYPLFDFTKNVGGDKVDVSLLVPMGVEPHDWEPSIQDLQKIQHADLVIINGVGFENWIHDIDSVNSDAKIVDTSLGISILQSYDEEHDTGEELYGDPHIWLNPVMAQKQVENIANSLSKIDPQNEKYYRQNAESYIKKLQNLNSKIETELSSCKKDFISFHNAFSYFANQYGLTQHNIIQSNEPHVEPTSKSLENIVNLARNLDSNIIFSEEAVDQRTSQVIADEIGGKVLTLSPIEIGDSNSDYIKKMEENLVHLKEALCN